MSLNLSADAVLSTTRSVRKRLDLDRPVPKDVILDCLQLAVQAPTGSFMQGWQWMFVDDPDKKQALADMYGRNFDAYRNSGGGLGGLADTDPRTRRRDAIRSSSEYLRDNFHRVPVLLIPLIAGRTENAPVFAQASVWGSILPAVWSFMLALRERGLGSAWTTLHLPNEKEAAELLGIPHDRYMQAGLFPIAYTIGTDFKVAERLDLDGIVHWNSW